MANTAPCFYYVPTWDWPPEGPVKLGNVLTSLGKPEQPLCTMPPPNADEIFSSEKTKVEYSKEKLNEGKFSVLTKFLSIFGVGVDVSANVKHSDDELYTFGRLETQQFVPNEDYIQKCVETAAVRRYLERCRYRKPVYVITGIKAVYGAKAKSHTSRAHGANVSVAADGTVWSGGTVPVGVGVGVEAKSETKQGTSWEGSSDFVFAFRVRKARVNKKTKEVEENDDYTKGSVLGKDKTSKIEEYLPDLFISSLGDPNAEDEGFNEEELMEGDTVVNCAIPKAESSDDED